MYLLLSIFSIFASALTFFSGFGLGTLLTPVFALFFPVNIAISLTAIVHLLNNLFKWLLVGRHSDKDVILKFGILAMFAAFLGAWLLSFFADLEPIFSYSFLGRQAAITYLKLIIAGLMIFFALFELMPAYQNLAFDKKYLPVGGLLSGFFGGLSGHQGALRSAFLIRAGLSKESFIATGVSIAVLIDFTRLTVYSTKFLTALKPGYFPVLAIATGSAFLGALLGNFYLKKITLKAIQYLVSSLLILIAVLLAVGIL